MAKFYITTAIDYANSTPHLGTAYEKIGADVIARYRRMRGDDVFFLMGNDEHSQNVRKKAEELGLSPKAYCDKMAQAFQETWKALYISNDRFIQTSSDSHHSAVKEIARRIHAGRDKDGRPYIFKRKYQGPYCVSCEAFYQEKDLVDGVCPNHKTKPEWLEEENYFFRLSAFQKPLEEFFDRNKDFVLPLSRRNELLSVLKEGLEDISISRPNRGWGVTLPFDETAVAYVWFDALINYVSALGDFSGVEHKTYWPADLHVIGKDITRFHCLIWPAMLMAASLEVPRAVWAHGFVYIRGEKMSKSRGNIADPVSLAQTYGAETLRYHLMREVPWDRDGDFTEERLRLRYNADLANDLGNLWSRTLSMVQKYLGGRVQKPSSKLYASHLQKIGETISAFQKHMQTYSISLALDAVFDLVSQSNLLIDREKPWALAKDENNRERLEELFYVLLEGLRWIALLLHPVMPSKSLEMRRTLSLDIGALASEPAPGKQPSHAAQSPAPLFPRLT